MQVETEVRSGLLVLAGPAVARKVGTSLAPLNATPLTLVNTVIEAERQLWGETYDVVLVDGWLPEVGDGLPDELFANGTAVLVLSELRSRPPAHWVPRLAALRYPAVLQASVGQARVTAALARERIRAERQFTESQGQMEHLLRLFGAGAPQHAPRWHSQRTMLERLAEEVARVERHGGNLSLVLAEFNGPEPAPAAFAWIAEQLTGRKRFCDVIGQYGPHGFMLLLPQTAEGGARECCDRLSAILRQSASVDGRELPWRLDYGVAHCQQPHPSAKGLLRLAEERLSSARQEEQQGKV